MKKGLLRYEYFLTQLETLLIKSAKQKNPGLWLYRNDARTPLFMLEGLSKMYAGCMKSKKSFVKMDEQFKQLEDILGAIDYYDAFANEFKKDKKIPASVITYLQAQTREKIQSLNETLKEKKWISPTNERLQKIRNRLSKVDWLKEVEEIKKIKTFYFLSIKEINAFVLNSKFKFSNVESDVHELRRKLRWLSIYPQALQGSIQLKVPKTSRKTVVKYLTKEVVESRFNQLPPVDDNKHILLLNQDAFHSLSWMIAELGRLKDNGLRVIAIKESIQQNADVTDEVAYKQVYSMLGNKQDKLIAILENAEAITKKYFSEKQLDTLIIGREEV